jgi:phosphonate transport system substrate-binding protein
MRRLMTRRLALTGLSAVAAGAFAAACAGAGTGAGTGTRTAQGRQPGTAANPLKMAFVPSGDTETIAASGKEIAGLLDQITGLKFTIDVATSYVAVIEAMGAGRADIGWLNALGYVLAHDRHGVELLLGTVRQGSRTYRGQIITHVDSGIKRLEDLRGKKFAFGDPASTSSYLFPRALLEEKGFNPDTFFSQTIFAGSHNNVVIAVYTRQVDGGATYGRSADSGPPTDARVRVQAQFPDVMEKVVVIAETDPIPNDTVSVRKDLPQELKEQVKSGLLSLAGTEAGRKALTRLYQIDGLTPEVKDADYDVVRRAARVLKLNLEEELKPKK